ncbi:hypothetical protein ACB092_09G160600 [Castanea dentata]
MVLSFGFSPVTVKYRRCTVSRYSDEICCWRLLKLSIESFSFFPSPFTTEVRTGSTARQAPVRRVGPVQRLELDFDQLGILESEGHVGVHAGSEVLHGLDDLVFLR